MAVWQSLKVDDQGHCIALITTAKCSNWLTAEISFVFRIAD